MWRPTWPRCHPTSTRAPGRCFGSTATFGSARTRALIRPPSACSSVTTPGGTRTLRASTSTWNRANRSWVSGCGTPTGQPSERCGSGSSRSLAAGARPWAIGGSGTRSNLKENRLKRPPRGFDPEHPLIEALKWKDYIGVRPVTEAFVTDSELPDQLASLFRAGTPFMRFLCKAVGVSF